jgi:hypothetical protein
MSNRNFGGRRSSVAPRPFPDNLALPFLAPQMGFIDASLLRAMAARDANRR